MTKQYDAIIVGENVSHTPGQLGVVVYPVYIRAPGSCCCRQV